MAFNDGSRIRESGPMNFLSEGLHLRALNVESGSKRFPAADDSSPPQTAHWRCNLIALSQRRNLLFVAYSHQIYVWEPAGSSQILGSKPEMIITPVMKEPRGSGYIQPAFPHEINNILVDDLGREEVLLLVTDSGNVCGYRVEAIFSALRRATEDENTKPFDGSQVDPFFLEYVGASAWGLAIHKFARLIAVSANTGLITVFAFALVNSASDNSDDSMSRLGDDGDFTDYGQTWLHIKNSEQFKHLGHLMPEKHRTRNIKLTYTGHFSNIPSVAFYNCDLDPNGEWMVSTDIDNKLLVWKIWHSLGPFNVYYFNEVTFRTFPDTLRNDERGWSVIALDPRTFHMLQSPELACGGPPQRRVKDGRGVLDLTDLTNRIPNASHLYHYFPPAVKAEREESVLPDFFGADCLTSRSNSASYSTVRNERDPSRPFDAPDEPGSSARTTITGSLRPSNSADTFSHRAVDGSLHEDNMSDDSASESDTDSQQITGHQELLQALGDSSSDAGDMRPLGHGPLTTPEFLQLALMEALGRNTDEVDEFLGENLEGDVSDVEIPLHYTDDGLASDSSDSDEMSETGAAAYQIPDPPANSNFPILHFSQTDIRLIPHPFSSAPSVICGAPLRQPFTHPIISIRHFDRFNMVKYVPEHGIVVAASQKGRAAVIALTESERTGYSFRVDWIVPFESQEKYGERPLVPLLGMTVSPMQGFEAPPDVPHIPRDADDNNLLFRYRDTHTNVSSASASSPGYNDTEMTIDDPTRGSGSGSGPRSRLTLPECHAMATRAYQPEESWRGWNPSRHYRLLLMYADHTVMSYEFWYTWNSSGGANDEDEWLIL